ncbi:MAG TPA: DUF3883 domain-containing protein [Nitrospiraceae bacterium]|jgi:hypothetical protein|nr:DUF3883 domain-containing protein [Nitrospiraceae bacterium]
MTFSIGVLYSSQTLLQVVKDGGLHTTNFAANFSKIDVADASLVLSMSQKCRWIAIADDGAIRLTERGTYLLEITESKICLREQLLDLILAEPPPWAKRIIQGRFEAFQAMPDAAQQCFRDCDLLQASDNDTVDWWDNASNSVRAERSRLNLEVGRKAEKLTLQFERERTGIDPIWHAIETSVAGFDVLSVVGPGSERKLKIEVKGSKLRRSEASFYLTRNEWQTAVTSREFQFHLWLVHEVPKLLVVPAEELKPHVPKDGLSGRWETAQLFYKDFVSYEYAASST